MNFDIVKLCIIESISEQDAEDAGDARDAADAGPGMLGMWNAMAAECVGNVYWYRSNVHSCIDLPVVNFNGSLYIHMMHYRHIILGFHISDTILKHFKTP